MGRINADKGLVAPFTTRVMHGGEQQVLAHVEVPDVQGQPKQVQAFVPPVGGVGAWEPLELHSSTPQGDGKPDDFQVALAPDVMKRILDHGQGLAFKVQSGAQNFWLQTADANAQPMAYPARIFAGPAPKSHSDIPLLRNFGTMDFDGDGRQLGTTFVPNVGELRVSALHTSTAKGPVMRVAFVGAPGETAFSAHRPEMVLLDGMNKEVGVVPLNIEASNPHLQYDGSGSSHVVEGRSGFTALLKSEGLKKYAHGQDVRFRLRVYDDQGNATTTSGTFTMPSDTIVNGPVTGQNLTRIP